MRFADVTGITIPAGEVAALSIDGVTVWEAPDKVTYAPIEWIQCNSDNAFDTGRFCDQDTKIELTFIRGDSTARYAFGVSSSDNKASLTGYQSGTSSGSWRFGGAYGRPAVTVDQENTVVMSAAGIYMNGTRYAYNGTIGTFVTPQTLAVGGCMSPSGQIGSTRFIGSLGRFKMWQGDDLVLDWEPHLRSDGVQGYWDHITGQFIAPA